MIYIHDLFIFTTQITNLITTDKKIIALLCIVYSNSKAHLPLNYITKRFPDDV